MMAISATLFLNSCEMLDADIALSEDFNPVEKLAFGLAGHPGAFKPGPGLEHKGQPGRCFEIVFPVTLVYPDKTTKVAASKEAFNTLLEDWKKANSGSKARPVLAFPFEVTLLDGSTVTVENEDGLKALAETCKPEGAPRGGICGGCFTPVFPVTISFPDGTSKTVNSAEAFKAAMEGWRNANPQATGHPQIVYPYSVKVKRDSSIVLLKNADDLKALLAACKEERPHRPSCFSIVFPVTIVYPDGKQESATDQKDYVEKVRTWRRNNPNAQGRPEMKFPITLKFTNGTTRSVASMEEWKAAALSCRN